MATATMSERLQDDLAHILKVLLVSPQDLLKIGLTTLDKRLAMAHPSRLSTREVVFTFMCWLREKVLQVQPIPLDRIFKDVFPPLLDTLKQRKMSPYDALSFFVACMDMDVRRSVEIRQRYEAVRWRLELWLKEEATLKASHGQVSTVEKDPLLFTQSRQPSPSSSVTQASHGQQTLVYTTPSGRTDVIPSAALKRSENGEPPPGYVCRRCGVKGHFVQFCPTNLDPSRDWPPNNDYVCTVCLANGMHWTTLCPRNKDPLSLTQQRLRAAASAPATVKPVTVVRGGRPPKKRPSREEAPKTHQSRDRLDSYRPQYYSTPHKDREYQEEREHAGWNEWSSSAAEYVERIDDLKRRIKDTCARSSRDQDESNRSRKRKISPSENNDGRLSPWSDTAAFAFAETDERKTKRRRSSVQADEEAEAPVFAEDAMEIDGVVGESSQELADKFFRDLEIQPKPPMPNVDTSALAAAQTRTAERCGNLLGSFADSPALEGIDPSAMFRMPIPGLPNLVVFATPAMLHYLGHAREQSEGTASSPAQEMKEGDRAVRSGSESDSDQPSGTQSPGPGTARPDHSPTDRSASPTPAVHPIMAKLKGRPGDVAVPAAKPRTAAADAWRLSYDASTTRRPSPPLDETLSLGPCVGPDAARLPGEAQRTKSEEGEDSAVQSGSLTVHHDDVASARTAAVASPVQATSVSLGFLKASFAETLWFRGHD